LKNIGLFWVPILNEALEVILGLLVWTTMSSFLGSW